MPPQPGRGQGNRSLLGTGAGKGDADRSPGYRKYYDDINFSRGSEADDGFRRVSPARIRKVYGSAGRVKITGAEIDAIFAPKAQGQSDVPPVSPDGTCCGGDCHCGKTD